MPQRPDGRAANLAIEMPTTHEVAGVIRGLKNRSARYAGPRTDLQRDPAALAEALDVLRVQHEELLLADEELRAQLHELQRVEAIVEEERSRSNVMFTTAPDAYVISDMHGKVIECNVATTSLLGTDEWNIVDKPLASYVRREDVPSFFELARKALGGAKPRARLRVRPFRQVDTVETSVVVAKTGGEGKLFWRFLRIDETVDAASVYDVPVAPRLGEKGRVEILPENARILVVTKDPSLVETFTSAAKHFGGIVQSADKIHSAIAALATFKAHIVIADLWSDGTLSFDIASELRLRNHRPVPLFVAVSGVGQEDATYAMKAGFHSFLLKPVSERSASLSLKTLTRILLKRSAKRARAKAQR